MKPSHTLNFDGRQVIICGATESGKTTLLKKLLKLAKPYDIGLIYTTTPHEWEYLKRGICLDYSKLDIINVLFNKKIKDLRKFVIIDNFIGECKLDDKIEKLFTQGRHFNITTFVLTQHLTKAVSPTIRENARYIFALKCSMHTYDCLFNYQNKFSKKKDFIEFGIKRDGYKPLLIDNNDLSLTENVFKF